MKKRILFVFGTRPEAIKLAPLIYLLKNNEKYFDVTTCSTGQHQALLNGIFDIFNITIDEDLNCLVQGKNLNDTFLNINSKLNAFLDGKNFDYVVVHGDTLSTLTGSLVAFLKKIKIIHIEAGLRTFNRNEPWPEEINRSIVGILADYHFAPTKKSYDNLINFNLKNVYNVGNTVIDAIKHIDKYISKNESSIEKKIIKKFDFFNKSNNTILLTFHRRENYGNGFENICKAMLRIVNDFDIEIIFPVHLNPNVKQVVNSLLINNDKIHLISPLEYVDFVFFMSKSFLLITDSGGIQEESTYFKKPVLICRNATERPEVIECGIAKLVGTDDILIYNEVEKLINDKNYYDSFYPKYMPFGDGSTCEKIEEIMINL
jgi:UDP-N-acetylglucosamine 2-epimerase (non-hydrolysing)